ncbi:MAG: AarF/ABC1/UbiB kinase family protein [bacterium]|nr:AarF/ABC1/UbiB kinase family protein [bacterium]
MKEHIAHRSLGSYIHRYEEIAGVLARYGLYRLAISLGLGRYVRWRPELSFGTELPRAAVIRFILEELGPAFVKMGQLLSTRADLLPQDYIDELSKLQENVYPEPLEMVLQTIEEEFGLIPFSRISDEPLAAASMGQVHDVTIPSGREAVVKVQRRGIRESIALDADIMLSLAGIAEHRWERARLYNLRELVREFTDNLKEELDYCNEGKNIEHIRESLKHDRNIYIHGVEWEFTTERVLTVEYVRGIRITDTIALLNQGHDLQKIAHNLVSSFMEQVFINGFFHGDPHPGNLKVMDDGRIALLDFGLVGSIDPSMQRRISDLFIGYVEEDTLRFSDALIGMGYRCGELDKEAFQHDAEQLLQSYYNMPIEKVSFAGTFQQAMRLAGDYHLLLPANYAILAKVFMQLEGISKQLDRNFNLLDIARPFAMRILRRRLIGTGPDSGVNISSSLVDLKDFIMNLPYYMDNIFRQAADGSFNVRFEHHHLEDFTAQLSKIGNRLAFSFIVAALLLSTALFAESNLGPFIFNYPLFAVMGFVLSAFAGVWLLVSIIRSGELG